MTVIHDPGIAAKFLPRARVALHLFLAVFLTLTSFFYLGGLGIGRGAIPGPLAALAQWTRPYFLVNHYGLFAQMTTERDEIVFEGSDDNKDWRPYEFRYKPGALDQRPKWVAPFQPRLDWQMWFAALGTARQTPWFTNLAARLLQGSPEVLALFAKNPFPDHPPRFLRARFYHYHFASMAEHRATGAWYTRETKGMYFGPASLK